MMPMWGEPCYYGGLENTPMPVARPLKDRFAEKYDICPSGCWTWKASRFGSGYGKIKVGRDYKGAHRVSYILHRGPIPEGLHVCHTCDNKVCVNPDHLFLGTRSDNMQDCVNKGRHARVSLAGELAPSAKLTDSQVYGIKHLYSTGKYRHKDIATLYGVCQATVSHILNGRHWGHVAYP